MVYCTKQYYFRVFYLRYSISEFFLNSRVTNVPAQIDLYSKFYYMLNAVLGIESLVHSPSAIIV